MCGSAFLQFAVCCCLKTTWEQNQPFQLHLALKFKLSLQVQHIPVLVEEFWPIGEPLKIQLSPGSYEASHLVGVDMYFFLPSSSSSSALLWPASSSAGGSPSISCWSRVTRQAEWPCGASRTPRLCSHSPPPQVRKRGRWRGFSGKSLFIKLCCFSWTSKLSMTLQWSLLFWALKQPIVNELVLTEVVFSLLVQKYKQTEKLDS